MKTLKDLTKWNLKGTEDLVIREIDLKEEAIKLIKEDIEYQDCTGDSFESLALMQPRIMKWINFFNVTEGDLE